MRSSTEGGNQLGAHDFWLVYFDAQVEGRHGRQLELVSVLQDDTSQTGSQKVIQNRDGNGDGDDDDDDVEER